MFKRTSIRTPIVSLVIASAWLLSACGGATTNSATNAPTNTAAVGSSGNPTVPPPTGSFGDTAAPRVVSTAPAGGTTNVSTGVTVAVFFSEAVALSSATATTFSITPTVPGAFSVSGVELRFKPSTALAANTQYRVSVQGIRDAANNVMSGTYAFSFTTAAATASCASGSLCVGPGQTYSTIQSAVDAVQPGQTVLVYDGEYDGFRIARSGRADAPIVIRAQGSGAIIKDRNAYTADGVRLDNASYITVEGFTIRGRDTSGVQQITERCIAARGATATSPMAGNVLRGNRCTDSGAECFYLSQFSSSLIEGNTILGCGRVVATRNHGIYLANGGSDNTIIRGNTISGAAGSESNGIHMNGDISVGGDGIISGLVIEGNTIYDNMQNGLNMDGVQNITVRNNLIYNNARNALRAYNQDGAAGPRDLVIVNNTMLATTSGWAVKISEDGGGHTMFNNILLGSSGSISLQHANFASNHNATDNRFSNDGDASTLSLAAWRSQTGEDSDSLTASASTLFASGGYQLASGSPARDAGVTSLNGVIAPGIDIVGISRPQGGAIDIGAYEAN